MEGKPMDSNDIPTVPLGLVEYLERMYPDRCPDGVDQYQWYVTQGHMAVVRLLRRMYTQQISR